MKSKIILLSFFSLVIALNISNAQDLYVAPLPPDDPNTPCNEEALAGCDRNYDFGMAFNEYRTWDMIADCMSEGTNDLMDPWMMMGAANASLDPLAGAEMAYQLYHNSAPDCLENVSEVSFLGFLYVIDAWHSCEVYQGNCPGRHD